MIYDSEKMEKAGVMQAAERIMAAARTAPKACGIDHMVSCVVTGDEKEALAVEMERLAGPFDYDFFIRDAKCIRDSEAVVLLGTKDIKRGLGAGCGYCHYKDCAECAKNNGVCVYDFIDLGIAIGSAVSMAADSRIDNRVLFSVGRAALSLNIMGDKVRSIFGIPLSASKKSPYFDRKD